MPNKPGWLYKYSETLKQETAYHCESGWVFCKDGTKYSPTEIRQLQSAGITALPLKIHTAKKVFEGIIVDIRHKTPPVAASRSEQAKQPATAVQQKPAAAQPEQPKPIRKADDIYDEYGRLQIW